MRGAFIGFGNVAVHGHVPGWRARSDVDIVAVTDARGGRRAEAEAWLPGARWYDSADDLMDRESLDFVDVCTPPSSHAGLIRAALGRGLHVLCEKPLVCSLQDLGEVGRLAAAAGRTLYTVHNWHHAPIVRRAGELVREGAIGRLRRVTWETVRTRPAAAGDGGPNWRVDPAVGGGGVLTDHGWHVFYVLGRWIGQAPTAISAKLETRRHTGWRVEDTATLRLDFPAATAEVLLTWAGDERRTRAELTGTDGTLRLEDDTLVLAAMNGAGGARRWRCPPALSHGSHHPDWFGSVAAEFVEAVRGGRRRDANLAEASLCAVLHALARESSARGEAVLPVVPPPLAIPPAPTEAAR